MRSSTYIKDSVILNEVPASTRVERGEKDLFIRFFAFAQNDDREGGYIALISAVVISILLIAITFSLSFTGFYSRFNVLDYEYKKVSNSLAEACVNVARIKLANDNSYGGNEEITLDAATNKKCKVKTVTSTSIQSQGVYQKAYTNLQVGVSISSTDIAVTSWQELDHF